VRRRLLRLVPFALVAACAGATCAPLASASTDRAGKPVRPDLAPLWSAFPLGQPRHAVDGKKPAPESRQAQARSPTDSRGSGSELFRLLVAVATGMLLAAVLAALGLGVLRPAQSFERRRGRRGRSTARLPIRSTTRIVYTRRFDIVLYGSAVALAVAAGWLVSSILNP